MARRNVHFSEIDVWQYQIGTSYAVIWSPAGKRTAIGLSTFTGRSWRDLEDNFPPISPSYVKTYIEKNRSVLA